MLFTGSLCMHVPFILLSFSSSLFFTSEVLVLRVNLWFVLARVEGRKLPRRPLGEKITGVLMWSCRLYPLKNCTYEEIMCGFLQRYKSHMNTLLLPKFRSSLFLFFSVYRNIFYTLIAMNYTVLVIMYIDCFILPVFSVHECRHESMWHRNVYLIVDPIFLVDNSEQNL